MKEVAILTGKHDIQFETWDLYSAQLCMLYCLKVRTYANNIYPEHELPYFIIL